MLATYSPSRPGKRLNVREEPNPTAPVVRTMRAGTEEATEVSKGWVKLDGGWADARFLTVTEGGAPVRDAHEKDDGGTPAEQQTPEQPADDDEARARLKKMTNPQLYRLAEDSGIKVAKGSAKAELIEAILDGADE